MTATFFLPVLAPVGSNPSPDKPVRAINTTQAAWRIRPLTPTINTKNSGWAQAPTPFVLWWGQLISFLPLEVFFLGDSTATRPERGGGGGTWWRCGDVGTSASPLGTGARGGQGQESRRLAARLLNLQAPSGSPACPFKARQSHFAPYTGRRE